MKKTKPVRRRKNTGAEYFFCLFVAATCLFLGISGIYNGSVLVGGTRRTPGTPIYGDEALAVSVAYIGCASLLILWLCRHSIWLPKAIGAVLIGNIIVAILAFNRDWFL
jgi:hypothetical protein